MEGPRNDSSNIIFYVTETHFNFDNCISASICLEFVSNGLGCRDLSDQQKLFLENEMVQTLAKLFFDTFFPLMKESKGVHK